MLMDGWACSCWHRSSRRIIGGSRCIVALLHTLASDHLLLVLLPAGSASLDLELQLKVVEVELDLVPIDSPEREIPL